MGVGRREFLRLSSLALTGLAVNPLQAVVLNDDFYVNKKLGILFRKPSLWKFVNVKDFGKLKDAQILADEWEDKKDEVWEDLGAPICIATKYPPELPGYKGVFSPTITLHITPKEELDDMEYGSFEELMEMSHYGVSRLLKNFTVVNRYEPYYISGCKFYEYDAEYLFKHIELDGQLKVELKVLKAEHKEFYYDFNCHQSSAQNQIAVNEFEEFKKSIKLI